MLQNIRDNSQGWIAKTIIGVIIVLLSLTGFDAIIRATDHSNVAAKVNGDDISLNEVQQAVDMQRRHCCNAWARISIHPCWMTSCSRKRP